MTPCSRSTLFRVILAIHLFEVGLIEAGRYALPRKWKVRYWDPLMLWRFRKISAAMLEVLHNNMVAAKLVNEKFAGKIGDTISVRRPERFAV